MSYNMSEKKNETKFEFSEENQDRIKEIFSKYPFDRKKSATLPLLDLAQRQNHGWLSDSAIEAVARLVDQPKISIRSVASFYTMYHLSPVGENVIEVCKTLSCKLRGGDEIQKQIEIHLGIKLRETTEDCKFTLLPCECLGACVNAPVVKVNDNFYEDLSGKDIIEILDALSKGNTPKSGSYANRMSSEASEQKV